MASVTIDMGFGRRVTLSTDGGSRQSLEHRSAVLELMLHWPKYTGLTTGAAGFGNCGLVYSKAIRLLR
ncbi:UNVERIFIED_ORG: hypothetical protein J2791_005349 [Burkholderia contaminans]|nr:hypothetical protein [Burkholderia contaminans]